MSFLDQPTPYVVPCDLHHNDHRVILFWVGSVEVFVRERYGGHGSLRDVDSVDQSQRFDTSLPSGGR